MPEHPRFDEAVGIALGCVETKRDAETLVRRLASLFTQQAVPGDGEGSGVEGGQRHLVLEVELPAMYIEDIEDLREFKAEGDSESDFILNCIGEPGVVSLTTEISGEKEGAVVSIWGQVRSASLQPASKGYGDGPHLTDDQLEQAASHRLAEAAQAVRRHDG